MTITDNSGYSARFIRFVRVPWHAEAYRTAYVDQSSAASNELERLRREYVTLPPRHSCSCRCPNEDRGWPACQECKRLREARVRQDIPAEYGSTGHAGPTMPMTLWLDLERALSVLGAAQSDVGLSTFLNGLAPRPALYLRYGLTGSAQVDSCHV